MGGEIQSDSLFLGMVQNKQIITIVERLKEKKKKTKKTFEVILSNLFSQRQSQRDCCCHRGLSTRNGERKTFLLLKKKNSLSEKSDGNKNDIFMHLMRSLLRLYSIQVLS